MENNFFVVKKHISSLKCENYSTNVIVITEWCALQTIEPINATIFGLENPGHNNELVVYKIIQGYQNNNEKWLGAFYIWGKRIWLYLWGEAVALMRLLYKQGGCKVGSTV